MSAVQSVDKHFATEKKEDIWEKECWCIQKVENDRQRFKMTSKMQKLSNEKGDKEEGKLRLGPRDRLKRREVVELHSSTGYRP